MIRITAIFLAFWASMASAQNTAAVAEAAAERLRVARNLLNDADSARDRVAALTATVQAYEEGLIAMRDGLRQAAIREQSLTAQLAAKSDEVSQLLGALQAMGRAPAPLLLLHPNGPTGTARSGMIVADITPAIQSEVDGLRLQLEEVAVLRAIQENATETLQEGLEGAQTARAALSNAMQERTDLPRRFAEDPVQTAILLASTETLDGFAAGLKQAFLTEGSATPISADSLRGGLPLPVQGQLLRRFNAPDAAGIVRPGVILAARPQALVTAPVAATLLFQGPLLDYGNVVILEPAADVLFVIAGLDQVYGTAGEVITAGTPIGLLGGDQPQVDAILNQTGNDSAGIQTETLYLEVREGQSPVNPATWFALDQR